MWSKLHTAAFRAVDIAPLVSLRVLFGLAMLLASVRFWAKGWIDQLYISPQYHFTYFGFDWVKVPPGDALYWMYGTMAVAALFMAIGLLYRASALTFFVLFTYVELIDVTTYLNHYYFISLASFLMIMVPANRALSVDCIIWPSIRAVQVPAWCAGIFKLQLGIVYFFAGLAKLSPDWMLRAQPLSIWLPPRAGMPIIGWALKYKASAYLFSWAGAIYDLLVPFLLYRKGTVLIAYAAVVGFHLVTGALFPIGVFPMVMILLTTVFFPAGWHNRFWGRLFPSFINPNNDNAQAMPSSPKEIGRTIWNHVTLVLLTLYFAIQVMMPMRHMIYSGNLFWHEQGFRFSWRVMLMEKEGSALFTVKDPETGRTWEVNNRQYLTPVQEKFMATQPDLILQFARIIEDKFRMEGVNDPVVTADVQVTLNGRRSRPYVRPDVDLTEIEDGWGERWWLMPWYD
jgi:hypothetical protein